MWGDILDKMQEDAIRRVREMQSGNMNRSPRQNHQPSSENPKREEAGHREIPQNPPEPKDPLAGLFKDKEKLLILLLIMLLSEESTNVELTLALLYIII